MEFGELVRDAFQYEWLVFTSVNGVEAFFDMFYRLYDDARSIGNVKIAAIGPATAQRIKDFHLSVDLQPKEFVAEAIIKGLLEFGSVENLKFLVVRALGAREVLPQRLAELGRHCGRGDRLSHGPGNNDSSGAQERFQAEGADLVTFTSSSTVENFLALKLPWPAADENGEYRADHLRNHAEEGLPVDVEATRYDVDGLVTAVLKLFARKAQQDLS